MRNHSEDTRAHWRKFFLATAGLALLAAPLLWAQAPAATASRPAFDVASVKPNKSGDNRVMMGGPATGGRFTATNVTLNMLVTVAYQLKRQQVSGLPDWGNSEHFDVEAKAEGSPPRDQIN